MRLILILMMGLLVISSGCVRTTVVVEDNYMPEYNIDVVGLYESDKALYENKFSIDCNWRKINKNNRSYGKYSLELYKSGQVDMHIETSDDVAYRVYVDEYEIILYNSDCFQEVKPLTIYSKIKRNDPDDIVLKLNVTTHSGVQYYQDCIIVEGWSTWDIDDPTDDTWERRVLDDIIYSADRCIRRIIKQW